jgi:hypothetical protein
MWKENFHKDQFAVKCYNDFSSFLSYELNLFSFTYPSTEQMGSLSACFLYGLGDRQELCVIGMKKETQMLALEDDLLVDLTFHSVPSLLSEFAEKIVRPYYNGNMNAAIQDLLHKTLREHDFIQSHITHIKKAEV